MRYAIEVQNEFESRGLQSVLHQKGYRWGGTADSYYDIGSLPYCIAINANKRLTCASRAYYGADPDVTVVLATDTRALDKILNPTNSTIELTLNSEYTAEINKDTKTVKVGCQEFSFDKVKELYETINQ